MAEYGCMLMVDMSLLVNMGLTVLRQVLELSGKLVPRIATFYLLVTGDGAEIVERDSMPGKQN